MVDKELVNQVVQVRVRVTTSCMKLVVRVQICNVICLYAPQIGLADDIKNEFWEELEAVIQSVLQSKKLFLGGDFNEHIETEAERYDMMHGRFGYKERNSRGTTILDFVVAYDLITLTPILRRTT